MQLISNANPTKFIWTLIWCHWEKLCQVDNCSTYAIVANLVSWIIALASSACDLGARLGGTFKFNFLSLKKTQNLDVFCTYLALVMFSVMGAINRIQAIFFPRRVYLCMHIKWTSLYRIHTFSLCLLLLLLYCLLLPTFLRTLTFQISELKENYCCVR